MTDSRTIHFSKMQGAGNDYIYINTFIYKITDPEQAAIKWSNRHFGIGSDGLVLIGAPSDPKNGDFSMRIFNADGSEAMMCGNASRCIAKYVYEKGMTDKTEIRLETKSGIKVLKLHLDETGSERKVESVTVDMGEPSFKSPKPTLPEETIGTQHLFVSMGNPHFVIFVDDINKVDVARNGSRLEVDPAFPNRCNIEFASLRSLKNKEALALKNTEAPVTPISYLLTPNSLRVRVWERGSGITMACGTGACATAVAAAKLGITGRSSDIIMDGGTLHIEWSEKDNHVYMTGPAEFAFEGDILWH